MHVNVVHLIGYLGKNPEHKSVKASDRKYAILSLATQRSWKGADEEWHSKTEWHRVVVIWNLGSLSIWRSTNVRPIPDIGVYQERVRCWWGACSQYSTNRWRDMIPCIL